VTVPAAPLRRISLGPRDAVLRRGPDGAMYVNARDPLGPYPRAFTERLAHWAAVSPDRVFLAQRDRTRPGAPWREITYARAFALARAVGQALLDRRLDAERPLVILSGNDLEHAVLALAAMHVGIAYAPVSPAYSTVSTDHGKLRHVLGLLTPGLVYVDDADAYARAIAAAVPADVEVVAGRGTLPDRKTTRFASLVDTAPGAAVDAAHAAIDGDTVLKFLFTSGSTANPKAVVNTHRMLCSNQQMYLQAFPFYAEPPLVLVDWQPWHHTAGGNANFGLVLYNGGTMYIDEGKPVAGAIEETVRNLREIAPTLYISVPRGFDELLPYLRREKALRERFFSRLKLLWYAGAGMSQRLWDELQAVSVEASGERVPIMTGLGATETAPYAFGANWDTGQSGVIGLPAAGLDAKLVPVGDKLEVRVRGPSILPAYWRQPEATRASFDDEGFYCMGDALRFVDPDDIGAGLLFDGRIAEDFKLDTGTWVSVGALRVRAIAALAPLALDVVVTGADRRELGLLVFPDVRACRALCTDLPADAPASAVLEHAAVRERFQQMLDALARSGTGSATRVMRMLLLDRPPALDSGEMTDKGSISQRTVLRLRADRVEALYAEPASPAVLRARTG
jgi:feruloyl-CoA synthase